MLLALHYNEQTEFVTGGKKRLELNIYSHASQAGSQVSGRILLRDASPLLCGKHPAVTVMDPCLSPSGTGGTGYWKLDWAALKCHFQSRQTKTSNQMQKRVIIWLHACQSISLFYLQLGQRSQAIGVITRNFSSLSFLLEYDNTKALISYESSTKVCKPLS